MNHLEHEVFRERLFRELPPPVRLNYSYFVTFQDFPNMTRICLREQWIGENLRGYDEK